MYAIDKIGHNLKIVNKTENSQVLHASDKHLAVDVSRKFGEQLMESISSSFIFVAESVFVKTQHANALNANDLVHFCYSSHKRSVFGLQNAIFSWNCRADITAVEMIITLGWKWH